MSTPPVKTYSHLNIVATQFWIWNSRTFQDFQGHFRQISRTYSIKIPGYSRTKIIFGPIFKDGDRQIQGHYGRTRSRVNEPDRPTITQIWVHANQGSLNHLISGWLHKQTPPPPYPQQSQQKLIKGKIQIKGGWIISFDFRIIVQTDTTTSLPSAIPAKTH